MSLDSSLRTVDEAEDYLELPVLASIPDRLQCGTYRDGQEDDQRARFSGRQYLGPLRTISQKERPPSIQRCRFPQRKRTKRSLRSSRVRIPTPNKRKPFVHFGPRSRFSARNLNLGAFSLPAQSLRRARHSPLSTSQVSLAQHGLRTVIIDGDMREPSLQRESARGSAGNVGT